MRKFCDKCDKEAETAIITQPETYQVFGEDITVDAEVLICSERGETLFCEELDSTTLQNVYNEYRRRHKLLLPEEIREQYGLSQRSFAKLLNWGDKTICRYENGAVQNKAHNSLLLFLRNPENMKIYLTQNAISLGDRQKKKLLDHIGDMENDKETSLLNTMFSGIPSEENGYQGFDYEKLCAMVLFFANKNKELLKTKLMKLLHYSDMIFFMENGISISGSRYVHLPYGPVPEHFDTFFDMMADDQIAHIEIILDEAYEKHQVIPECSVPDDILSEKELDTMERVFSKFRNFGSVEISEYSHKEKGYISTRPGQIISYAFASDIRL